MNVKNKAFDSLSEGPISEVEIAEWIDVVKQSPELRDSLVELLPERNLIFSNRSTNEAIRIKGYAMAAFEKTGLPEAAVPYVLDELENGRNAYLVAAAAKALRGLAAPTSYFNPFLLRAIENIKYVDDALTFDSYRPQWPTESYTTALTEIFATFQWLGSQAQDALPKLERMYADETDFSPKTRDEIKKAMDSISAIDKKVEVDCCSTLLSPTSSISPLLSVDCWYSEHQDAAKIAHIEFEDQDSSTLYFSDFFSGLPSIVVFFYSRCSNPNKCSLTITKLAKLQKIIREQGLEMRLKTAAITYDPDYDLSSRMKAYGENRGVLFNDRNRMLRTRTDLKRLQDYFQLGVNYNNTIVNRHRIELFILDKNGSIAFSYTRLQWDIYEVLSHAKSLLTGL